MKTVVMPKKEIMVVSVNPFKVCKGHIRQTANKFQHKTTKRNRTRQARNNNALGDC